MAFIFFADVFVIGLVSFITLIDDTFHLSKKTKKNMLKNDKKEIIRQFETKLRQQTNLLFAIRLYWTIAKPYYSDDAKMVDANTQALNDIMKKGESVIIKAQDILKRVQGCEIDLNALEQFEFLPFSEHPHFNDMTRKAKILVEAYEKLFPGRPREKELTEEELLLIENEAMKDLKK
ncbi:hypothetical protein KAX97_12905 [candidate division WOR-3 bacterium]|nr:hypothetical protein [candidate division WOR-3 bacterium]